MSHRKDGGAIELQQTVDGEFPSEFDHDPSSTLKSGTSRDELDMQRMGQPQQLNRQFDGIAIFGLTAIVLATWLGMLASFQFPVADGGRAGAVWGYLICGSLTLTVVASMAEMASMAPTSGGQYHWVSEFSHPSFQKPLSYASGWLSALGWQAIIAVGSNLAASIILILASTANPNYVFTGWQTTLAQLAVVFFAFAFNVWGARRLPMFEGIMLFIHVIGFFAALVPLWVLAPKASAKDVFTDWGNVLGWPTTGVATIVGLIGGATALLGADSAAHMSEEVRNASLTVPRMMMWTIILNFLMGFASLLTIIFAIQDLDTQVYEATGFPFVAIFATSVGSTAGAIGMTVPIAILTIGICVNATAAGSRQAYSFARDNGLPFPTFFSKITSVNGTPLPINATLFTLTIPIIGALLNLGGSEVFNSLSGLVDGAFGATYTLSISCVLWRKLFGAPLPPARWSLGRFGIPLNVIAILYEVFITIMCYFPTGPNPKPAAMNWGSAMFGGIVIICTVNYWVRGRKIFEGPVVKIRKDM